MRVLPLYVTLHHVLECIIGVVQLETVVDAWPPVTQYSSVQSGSLVPDVIMMRHKRIA